MAAIRALILIPKDRFILFVRAKFLKKTQAIRGMPVKRGVVFSDCTQTALMCVLLCVGHSFPPYADKNHWLSDTQGLIWLL